MREQEIKKRVEAQPFRPFALHLWDGSRYEIRESDGLYITRTLVIIGLDPDQGGIPTDSVLVDPAQNTRLAPLKSNGARRLK